MGKVEEEQSLSPPTVDSQTSDQNAENRCRFRVSVRLRCILGLVLGVAVLLSAVFWLPPFIRYGNQWGLDLDSQFRDHDMVASFMLEKPVSFLEHNILMLEDNIFDVIEAPTTKVEIISLKPVAGSANISKVVFAIVPKEKSLRVSSTDQSLIRSLFVLLASKQYTLRLTASLFGNPFSFDVLKFPGGITVIPPQNVFLLQKVQISFNFTLNFSIDQIQDNFNELTSQLKSGLHLALYENLYIKLMNSEGSTVAPLTDVETSVLLAIGNPSVARSKQLAQTITGSHTKNLGLNNTVFGRVKQVRLSSLQHSFGGDASPTPAPSPYQHHHHQHHHHHHHQHHHHHHHYHHNHHHHHHHHHHHNDNHHTYLDPNVAPAPATEKDSPAPAPSSSSLPEGSHRAKPPGCQSGYTKRLPRKVTPAVPPIPPRYPASSPHQQVNPAVPFSYQIPASSPLPNVVFPQVQPPTKSAFDTEPPDITPSVLPSTSPCLLPASIWAVVQFLVLVLLL